MLLKKWKWLTHEMGGWYLWDERPLWDDTNRVFVSGGESSVTLRKLLNVPPYYEVEDDRRLWKRDGENWILTKGQNNGTCIH